MTLSRMKSVARSTCGAHTKGWWQVSQGLLAHEHHHNWGCLLVSYDEKKQQLTLWRPQYLDFTRYRARITPHSVGAEEK